MANNEFLSLMKPEHPVSPHHRKKKRYFSDWLFNTNWGSIVMKILVFGMMALVGSMVVFYVWAVSEYVRHPEKLGEMTLIAEGQGCQTYKVSRYLDTTYFTKCKDVPKVTNKYRQGKQRMEVTTETIME